MNLKIFNKFVFTSFIGLITYTGYECHKQNFSSQELYYFLNGFYRGIRSIKEGAKVVINYKLVKIL